MEIFELVLSSFEHNLLAAWLAEIASLIGLDGMEVGGTSPKCAT